MLDVSGALSRVMEAWRSTPAWAHTGERRHQPIAELLWGLYGDSCPGVPMCGDLIRLKGTLYWRPFCSVTS